MRSVAAGLLGVVAAWFLTISSGGDVAQAQQPGIRIAWDYSTIVRPADRGGDYARLERIGESDTLVLAYGFGSVKISPDNGQTWGPRIAGAQGDANGHPYNMELMYLGNGTLLLLWNYRSYGADGVPFSIRVNASTDGGKTHTLIIRGGLA